MAGEPKTRTASCCCGALTATARGEPVQINMCSCHACQQRSGSAFTYTAFFPEADVNITGAHRQWRRSAHSGGTHDACFCPECASSVVMRLTALPGLIGISAGCFADSAFAKPQSFYWSSQRHQWFAAGADIVLVDTQ